MKTNRLQKLKLLRDLVKGRLSLADLREPPLPWMPYLVVERTADEIKVVYDMTEPQDGIDAGILLLRYPGCRIQPLPTNYSAYNRKHFPHLGNR